MELGPKDHSRLWFVVPNSRKVVYMEPSTLNPIDPLKEPLKELLMVVYMDPLGYQGLLGSR